MIEAPVSLADLHEDQVIALLRSGAHAALLSAYFGEIEYRELCRLAKLAAARHDPHGPLVFLLPGIMGSRLGTIHDPTRDPTHVSTPSMLWLHPASISDGALVQLALPGPSSIQALGVMLPGYLKLKLSLEVAGFHAIFHPFDWRRDLHELARELMQAVDATGSAAHIVGHSMGGLVARYALAHDRHRRIRRLVQLGSPNSGSFAPLQALRAVYPTVRKIAALDHEHTAEDLARRVFLTLPGLYQMLPSPEEPGQADLFDPRSWPDDELPPDPKLLACARQRRATLPDADDRCAVIAGINRITVVSAAVCGQEEGFEYLARPHGDGTVPVSRALWSGARTWFAEEKHGALTHNDTVIAAVIDLLRTGDCERLHSQIPKTAAEEVRRLTDQDLRAATRTKVPWDTLSLDSRRRILEPVISPEFRDASRDPP